MDNAIALLTSLYDSGDLSVDQHAGIMRGFQALLAELEAARGLIDLMRAHFDAGGEVPGSFPARLDAYDAAREASDDHA